MGCVDGGNGAYRVSLQAGHVNHPVPQLPVIPIVLPNVVHPRPQETDDFAVCVVVSYKVTGGDVSASSDACDRAMRHNVP